MSKYLFSRHSRRQDRLTAIFESLLTGREVAGWGMSQHKAYDVLFNDERRLWIRFGTSRRWRERAPNDADDSPPKRYSWTTARPRSVRTTARN